MAQPKRRRQRSLVEPRARGRGTNHLWLALVLAGLVAINLYVFLWNKDTSIPAVMRKASVAGQTVEAPTAPSPGEPGGDVAAAAGDNAGETAEPETRWVDGTVAKGDSLGQILRREGLTPPEADALIRALRPVMDFRKIQQGQHYRIQFDRQGVVIGFEFQVSKIVTVRATRGADGALTAESVEAATETRVHEVHGTIDSSLWAAMMDAGEDGSLVGFFVDVFAYDINFYVETRDGDRFKMLVEKVYLDDEFLHYGRVLAAEYAGSAAGTHHAFWWKAPDARDGRYYTADGRSVEKSFLKSPLKFTRVSSKFNPKRMHPILHRTKGHWGVDYAAPTGTPVWAAAGGKITYRGPRGGAGNCVIVQHANGFTTIYMHLSKFRSGQKVGQRVAQKEIIGYVGMTGLATGPHLHFGVKKNGQYVDPMTLKLTPGPPVPAKHMELFKRDTGGLVAQLDGMDAPPDSPREIGEVANQDPPHEPSDGLPN